MVQNFTPPWKSVLETGNKANLVKSPQVAAALGNKVDADGGQSIRQSIQSGALDSATTLDGVTISALLAASVRAQIASVAQFKALTTAADVVFLTSWDGTARTRNAAGVFVRIPDGPATDHGTVIVTAGAGTYRRLFHGGVDPAWYGAIGDGASHPASTVFATLADLKAVFPDAYSLDQEMDWLAVQAASLSGYGLNSARRDYMMCNAAVATADAPLVWIPGLTFGSFGGSTFDFTALKAVSGGKEFVTNGTFSDASGAGWENASIYQPYAITPATFTTGAAVHTDPASGANWQGTVANGTMTVTNFSGGPALAVGAPVYDANGVLAAGTTITALGSGTGGNGTYQISDTSASIATAIGMQSSTGHYAQFGQKLTLPAGNYTVEVDYEVTLGASYANGNVQPGNISLGFSSDSPGAGANPWDNSSSVAPGYPSSPISGTLSFSFNVEEQGSAWLSIGISGYLNARISRVSVVPMHTNAAILSTRDGALEHYPTNATVEGFILLGAPEEKGLRGVLYNSFHNTDGRIHNFARGSIRSFDIGIEWMNGAYLAQYFDFEVIWATSRALVFKPGNINAGENFRWYGGSLSNSQALVYNPGGAEFSFYGTTVDYSNQIIEDNTGHIEMHAVHCEMKGPASENLPLFHCSGSGYLGWFGGLILVAGSSPTFPTPPIWVEHNLSLVAFYKTQIYNLTSADGRAGYGSGIVRFEDVINTGNPIVGTVPNANSDPLGLAGKFIPQASSTLCRDGIGLIGGLFSDIVDTTGKWTSTGASVTRGTDHTYNGNPGSLKVMTQGQGRNDRLILCIPLKEGRSGYLDLRCLFPYDMTQDGLVPSTNSDPNARTAGTVSLYARAYYCSITGYDAYGRPEFGARDLFAGESDFVIPKQGCTTWMEAGFASAYLGLPRAGKGEQDLSLQGAGGSPAFATHLAIVLDSESLPATAYYIGEFGGVIF